LTAKEFVEYAQADSAWRAALERAGVERCDFPDADHTFSSERASREVESRTLAWLSESVLAAMR